MKYLFLFTIAALFLFVSCDKNQEINSSQADEPISTALEEGESIFSGFFTTTSTTIEELPDGNYKEIPFTVTISITLELINGKFICADNDIPREEPSIYGSGTYSIENNKIIFIDENARIGFHPYDWLLLSGEYSFMFDGQKLKLSKNHYNNQYKYDLERI